MTDPQALELARRIANCWRGGSPLNEWVAELAHLDHQPALTTFERLRRLLEVPPSIPRFLTEYRAITATTNAHPHEWPTLNEPRLTREQRMALLTAGAPRHMVTKQREAM